MDKLHERRLNHRSSHIRYQQRHLALGMQLLIEVERRIPVSDCERVTFHPETHAFDY